MLNIVLSLFAARIARRPATPEKTYSYLRIEILAVLINGTAILVIAGVIVVETTRRMGQPHDVQPGILSEVATAGLMPMSSRCAFSTKDTATPSTSREHTYISPATCWDRSARYWQVSLSS